MRAIRWIYPALIAGVIAGCGQPLIVVARPEPRPDVVVVYEDDDHDHKHKHKRKKGKGKGPRFVELPPGYYPPPGYCRVWYADRPPGHQPAPVRCSTLRGRVYGTGVFILYDGRPWDADYDWDDHEREHPRSVPNVILQLMVRL